MHILALLIRKCVALRDFWHIHISTYTYLGLISNKDLKTQFTESKDNATVHNAITQDSIQSFDYNPLQSLQHEQASSIVDMSLESSSLDSMHNKMQSQPTIIPDQIKELHQYIKLNGITLAQLYGITRLHWLANILKYNASMQLYYAILPLDSLTGTQIYIEKSYLRQENMLDTIVPLQAQIKGIIPHDCECRYFLQNQTQTHFVFQIFSISQSLLQQYSAKYAGKIFCINPLELFCGLFALYPHLTNYTIIFQDSHKHALCHYENGALVVSVLLERKEALQNHYWLIKDFGTIFYCDFSGKPDLLCDFTDITTLFNMPLLECLHILALHHIRTKPTYIDFYSQAFYSVRSKLKALLFCSFFMLIFYFGAFYYNKYQYYKFLQGEEQAHYTQIETLYYKKQQYPLMYERIYNQLLDGSGFNFCLRQDYKKTLEESIWIQSQCVETNLSK